MKIGEYQTLTIAREKEQGYYLENNEDEEVLLPRKYMTDDMQLEDEIRVFVYIDSNGRGVATTEKPVITVGQFGFLKVTATNQTGAFCAWGINKELFIPFRNQRTKLKEGESYVVYLYLDEKSDRLVGTTKLKNQFKLPSKTKFKVGQEVEILVYEETEIGFKAVVNQKYTGLLYKSELDFAPKLGAMLKAFVKPLRSDKKIDLSIKPIGVKSIEPNAASIMKKLKANEGFLPYTDKSDPKLIMKEFGISKKLFKKAIGSLYKQKLIYLDPKGIFLTENKDLGKKD